MTPSLGTMDTPDFDHAVPLCITYNNRNSLLFPLTPTRSDRWHFDIIQKCARIYTFEFQHTIFKTLSKKSIRCFCLKFLHFLSCNELSNSGIRRGGKSVEQLLLSNYSSNFADIEILLHFLNPYKSCSYPLPCI